MKNDVESPRQKSGCSSKQGSAKTTLWFIIAGLSLMVIVLFCHSTKETTEHCKNHRVSKALYTLACMRYCNRPRSSDHCLSYLVCIGNCEKNVHAHVGDDVDFLLQVLDNQ